MKNNQQKEKQLNKGFIFDMDGTLLESMSMWSDVGNKYIKKNGIQHIKDIQLVEVGKSFNEKMQEMIDFYSLSKDLEQIKVELDYLVEDDYRTKVMPKDKFVIDFLERAKLAGIKMCVATATSTYLAKDCLSRLGMFDFFDLVISTKDINTNKFKPDIFFKCCETMNLKPCEVTVFEDALYALKTANNAGFQTVGIFEKCFKEDWNEIKHIATFNITSFSELDDFSFSK